MAAPSYGGRGRFIHQPKIECTYSYILPPPLSHNEEIILEVTFGKDGPMANGANGGNNNNNNITRGYVMVLGGEEKYASAIVLIKPSFEGRRVMGCRIIRPVTKEVIAAIQAHSQWIPEAFTDALPLSVQGGYTRQYFSTSGMNSADVCVLRKVAYNRLPWAIEAPLGLVQEVVATMQYDNGAILVRSMDSLKPLAPQPQIAPLHAPPNTMLQHPAAPPPMVQMPIPIPITAPVHVNQHHYSHQNHHRGQRANGLNGK